MSTPVGTYADSAPSGWYIGARLKIGFSFMGRFTSNGAVIASAHITGMILAYEIPVLLRWLIHGELMPSLWLLWLLVFGGGGAVAWGLVPGWGLTPVESLRRQVMLTTIVFVTTSAVIFTNNPTAQHPWLTIICAYVLAVPMIPLLGMLAKRTLIRHNVWGIPVAIYGGGHAGQRLVRCLLDEPGQGYYPVCIFDDDPELLNSTIEGVPVRGKTDTIAKTVPVAILAMSKIGSERTTELLETSLSTYLRVMIIPHLVHTPWLWASVRDMGGLPSLELTNHLLDPAKCLFKRGFELGVICITLPVWGPVCLLLTGLIWLGDRKHPIFKQTRVGLGGDTFETLKFRTMVPDAEAVLRKELERNPDLRAEWEANCKLNNDPRLTMIGKFLRRSSLDELPQLINVLRGEMSLIGPRPLPNYHHDQLLHEVRRLRERVRPGMTGLWQVSGRSDTGNEGFERWDPYYVRNWSLWLDIVILVRTVRVVVTGSGAR